LERFAFVVEVMSNVDTEDVPPEILLMDEALERLWSTSFILKLGVTTGFDFSLLSSESGLI